MNQGQQIQKYITFFFNEEMHSIVQQDFSITNCTSQSHCPIFLVICWTLIKLAYVILSSLQELCQNVIEFRYPLFPCISYPLPSLLHGNHSGHNKVRAIFTFGIGLKPFNLVEEQKSLQKFFLWETKYFLIFQKSILSMSILMY